MTRKVNLGIPAQEGSALLFLNEWNFEENLLQIIDLEDFMNHAIPSHLIFSLTNYNMTKKLLFEE